MNQITIYTDGACKGNPGIGGWGAVLQYSGKIKEIYGGELNTTNNRMELMAAIQALSKLKYSYKILLCTDSKYLQNGILRWLDSWSINKWKSTSKKPIKNQDLWQKLNIERHKHDIQLKWVKSHSGDPMNELADSLANKGVLIVTSSITVT